MTGHEFGDIVCDPYGRYHSPCSCGVEVRGYNLLDLHAARAVHLSRAVTDDDAAVVPLLGDATEPGQGGAA